MRNKFDRQLDTLNSELIKMGAMCEEAIATSVSAALDGVQKPKGASEEELIERTQAIENEIDRLERSIEGLCMRLLLQQQPVATDLRTISSAPKMISDMERIGDQASDIALLSKYVSDSNIQQKIHIKEMAKAVINMVTESVDSFVKKDLELAQKVMADDDIVDSLFDKVKNELIGLIGENTDCGEVCMDLLMVAKYFERIGDHAVNIAEWVEYSITGRRHGSGGNIL